jgi:hypothetical protein
MLLHLKHDAATIVAMNFQRLVDGGKGCSRDFHIDDGADYASDRASCSFG